MLKTPNLVLKSGTVSDIAPEDLCTFYCCRRQRRTIKFFCVENSIF